jgi:hypothetical protein
MDDGESDEYDYTLKPEHVEEAEKLYRTHYLQGDVGFARKFADVLDLKVQGPGVH